MQLEAGQVAVITGGASGIGLALALAFAERGLNVAVADVSAGPLDEAVAAIKARGVDALGVATDVRDAEQVDAFAAQTLDRFGGVDVVCNNAGVVSAGTSTWETSQGDWEWVIGVNLMGMVHGIRAFVPHLVAQNRGHVVNTASIAGLIAQAGTAPYSVSKHGVVALSEGLQLELANVAPDVGVTVVCPGIVDTNILSSGRDTPSQVTIGDIHRERARADDPASRPSVTLWAPSDVATMVVDAIEANRLHVAPHDWLDQIKGHFSTVLADLSHS